MERIERLTGVRLSESQSRRAMKRMGMSFEKVAPLPGEADEQLPRNFYVQGKWHLDGHPMDRGFDAFFGFLAGFADHFTGAPSYRDGRAPFTKFGADYFSTDAFTGRAISFVKGDTTKPFFLYLSYQAPRNRCKRPPPTSRSIVGNTWQAGNRCARRGSGSRRKLESSPPMRRCQ